MSASCSVKPRCVVGLFSSSLLSGALFGLKIVNGELELDPDAFACCAGLGLIYREDTREAARCAIRKNHMQTKEMFKDFTIDLARTPNDTDVRAVNKSLTAVLLQEAERIKRGESMGLITNMTVDRNSRVGGFWPLCFALSWRAGLKVCLANFARRSAAELALHVAHLEDYQCLAIGGLHKLSDPLYADTFEALVSYAYNAQIPIVLDGSGLKPQEIETKPESPVAGFSTKGMFKVRAEQLKRRHALQYVQSDCLSRLREMIGDDARLNF